MKEINKSLSKDFGTFYQELELQALTTCSIKSNKKSFHLDTLDSDNKSFYDTNFQTRGLIIENDIYKNPISLLFLLRYLLPNLGSPLVPILINCTEFHFIGKTKNILLYNGVCFGNVYSCCILNYFCMSLSDTIPIINPKSLTNKKIRRLVRDIFLLRLITTAYFFLILIFNYYFMDNLIFLLVGNVPYTIIIKQYIWLTSPGYFMSLHYNIYCKYAESQYVYKPVFIGMMITSCIHPILSMIFIYKLDYQIYGICIVMNLIEFIKIISMIIYFLLWDPVNDNQFKFKFKMNLFKKVILLLQKSIINVFINYHENIGLSICNIFATYKGEIMYTKYIILSKISYINYFLCNGFQKTIIIIIRHYFKLRQYYNFKKSILYFISIAFILETSLIWFINYNAESLVKFFMEKEFIFLKDEIENFILIVSANMILEIFYYIFNGIIVGIQSTNFNILSKIVIFLVIQTFLCLLTNKLDYGIKGIWASKIICLITLNFIYVYEVCKTDYNSMFVDFPMNLEDSYLNEEKSCRLLSRRNIN